MTPFEDLILELGQLMDIPLKSDAHQSCRLEFYDKVMVQIDLDGVGDRILIGSVLGTLTHGNYRNQILKRAMQVNGLLSIPRGILAYSELSDTLVLFQHLSLKRVDGQKLFRFVSDFHEHAHIWVDALEHQEIPEIQQDLLKQSGYFGSKQ